MNAPPGGFPAISRSENMTERKGRKVTKVPKPKKIGTKSRTAFGAERSEMR